MSYILDALKKSESERGHGAVPGVQTVHSSSINYHQQKKAIWPYFLIIAVLLNIVVIAYFIYTQNTPTQTALIPTKQETSPLTDSTQTAQNLAPEIVLQTSVTQTPTPTPSENSSTKATQSTPVTITTETQSEQEKNLKTQIIVDEQEKDKPDTSQISEPASDSYVEIANEKILEQYELPENIQRQLPALVISAHVYSTTPSQRSIIINDEFFEEKDYIMDDIILHEITPDGAIFNYNGFLFHNRSVSGWQ